MKLLITRPVVITGLGGVRAFVPGLTIEADAATAELILARQAGIAAVAADLPATPRRRKSADAET